jgi:hypothetical protein
MRNVSAESKCKEVERDTRDNRIFSRGIKELTLTLIHVGALTKSIAPPQVTKTQVPTKTIHSPSPEQWVSNHTKIFLRLPQSPRAHQEPSKHQDHLGVVNLQEYEVHTLSLDLSTKLSHDMHLETLYH